MESFSDRNVFLVFKLGVGRFGRALVLDIVIFIFRVFYFKVGRVFVRGVVLGFFSFLVILVFEWFFFGKEFKFI